MSEEFVDQGKLAQVLYGQPIPVTDDSFTTITTVNRTLNLVETDAFKILEVTLESENVTSLVAEDVTEDGRKFKITFEYLEEENKNGE